MNWLDTLNDRQFAVLAVTILSIVLGALVAFERWLRSKHRELRAPDRSVMPRPWKYTVSNWTAKVGRSM